MRFSDAHKAVSYVAIFFAVIGLLLSGAVEPPFALAFAATLWGSWYCEAPRVNFERWNLAWTLATFVAFAFTAVFYAFAGDYLGGAAFLLLFLLCAKACNRRAARDWLQFYLLGFLCLVLSSVLNPGLLFALCFLGFVLTSTWTLTLFHLRRELETSHAGSEAAVRDQHITRVLQSRRIVGPAFYWGTALLSVFIFVCSSLLFFSIPRVGMGFFLKAKGGPTFTGFADGVKLGGHGLLKDDATIVMRVKTEGPVPTYWRGGIFDTYRDGSWSRSRQAEATTYRALRRKLGWEYRALEGELPSGTIPDAAQLSAQTIWLEPLDTPIMFAGAAPVAYEFPMSIKPPSTEAEALGEVRFSHDGPINYRAWSDLYEPSAEELRQAKLGLVSPTYLQIPDEITDRTLALATELTGDASTRFDKAEAIRRWLSTNLSYSRNMVSPGGKEPIDFFLFDRQAGHCEYFASAFVILARAAGVPARQVTGFYGGEWNEYEHYTSVRAGDAHAWAEVYFGERGWITFDATPTADSETLPRHASGFFAKMRRFFDSLRFRWSRWVVDYSLQDQLAALRRIGKSAKSVGKSAKASMSQVKAFLKDHGKALIAIGLVGAGIVVWLRRNRGPLGPGLGNNSRGAVHQGLDRAYWQARHALARVGVPGPTTMTPHEVAAACRARAAEAAAGEHRTQLNLLAEAFDQLTGMFCAAVYGEQTVDADGYRRATQLAGQVKAAAAAAKRATPKA